MLFPRPGPHMDPCHICHCFWSAAVMTLPPWYDCFCLSPTINKRFIWNQWTTCSLEIERWYYLKKLRKLTFFPCLLLKEYVICIFAERRLKSTTCNFRDICNKLWSCQSWLKEKISDWRCNLQPVGFVWSVKRLAEHRFPPALICGQYSRPQVSQIMQTLPTWDLGAAGALITVWCHLNILKDKMSHTISGPKKI